MTAIATNLLNVRKFRVSPRTTVLVILGLGCALSLALNWPGQLSYDSVVQLHDGRSGHYNPWHPPVMAWLLGVEDALLPGTGLFILTDALLIFASLASLLLFSRRASWAVIPVAALCSVLPQFVLYQGIVWKDVLFADAAVAGFVLLAQAASCWQKTKLRWLQISLSFLFLALATLVRQNGAIALVSGGLSLAVVARANGSHWRKAIVCGAGGTLVAASMVFVASLALLTRTGGVSGTPGQIRLLQLYDLTGVAKIDPAVPFDVLSRANPDLGKLIRSDGTRLYTPARNDTLIASMALQREFNATAPSVMSAQWDDIVLHHPADYLRVRLRVFAWTFFTPDPVQCDAWYTGVTGPPAWLRSLKLARPIRRQDRALAGYAASFASTPVLSHASFAVLAVVLLLFVIRRRNPADLAIAGLLAAALFFAASFFVISIACDYRYLFFLDLAALASLFYWAVSRTGDGGISNQQESAF